jgi:hypothetical protein
VCGVPFGTGLSNSISRLKVTNRGYIYEVMWRLFSLQILKFHECQVIYVVPFDIKYSSLISCETLTVIGTSITNFTCYRPTARTLHVVVVV